MIYFSEVFESSTENIQHVKNTYTIPKAEWGEKYFSFYNYGIGHQERRSKTVTSWTDNKLLQIYRPILSKFMRKHELFQPGTGIFTLNEMWGEVYNTEVQTVSMSRQHTSNKVVASWVHLTDVPGKSGLSFLFEDGEIHHSKHQNNSLIFFSPGVERCIDVVDGDCRVFVAGNVLKLR